MGAVHCRRLVLPEVDDLVDFVSLGTVNALHTQQVTSGTPTVSECRNFCSFESSDINKQLSLLSLMFLRWTCMSFRSGLAQVNHTKDSVKKPLHMLKILKQHVWAALRSSVHQQCQLRREKI